MVIKRSSKWIDTAQELYRLEGQLKKIQVQYKETKESLKVLSNNEDARGGNFMFFREYRKGNVNYLSIPGVKSMVESMNVDPYRNKDAVTWKLKQI